ncbi:hypothetical protein GCM10023340_45330 [Nocardioides marinquilinus]|uniref:Uncharacterized protein n=1 Tax=Nocardioides marinquilinus TaxID=1210400 RepID=A0ABP9Q529_9ACTN
MTTLPDSTPAPSGSDQPLRLRLGEITSDGGDGAWWPRSRDLQVEAARLVDEFPVEAGRINRLLMSRPDWDDSVTGGHGVRRIRAARGVVKVGSFPRDDTSLMILAMANGGRVHLQVIPADIDPDRGERLLAAAGSLSVRDQLDAAHG